MSKGEETFKTDDFLIYVFDRNDTDLNNVSKFNVEDLYSSINSKSFLKNVAFISPANSLLWTEELIKVI